MKVVSDLMQLSQTFSVSGSETKKKASVFDTILAAANSGEETATANDDDYVEPAGVHRSKNVCYFGDGVIFPPVGTPKEFLKVWDSTLDALDPVSRGKLEGAIMDALVFGDYHYGENIDDSGIRAAARMKTMSFGEIIQLAIDGQKHLVEDAVAAGVDQEYIDIYNQRVKNVETLLNNWLKTKPDDDVVDLLLKDKEDK